MDNILQFDQLVLAICKETKPRGKGILEEGFQFVLCLDGLMRGQEYPQILEKLSIKNRGVCEATLKRFHKKYSKEIDPVRKIGILIKDGRMKPTEMLHIDYPGGDLSVRKLEEQDLKIREFEDPIVKYAKLNAIQSMRNPLPRSIQEYGKGLETGEIVHLTGREFKEDRSQKPDMLSRKFFRK